MSVAIESVLAVDPGLVSGWATWESGRFAAGEHDPHPMCDFADEWMSAHAGNPNALVVVEAFIITEQTLRKTRQYWSLEIIGALKWRASVHGVRYLDPMQTPSQAKRFGKDKRLKDMGLWHPTPGGHANDACRHLCLALSKCGAVRPTVI